MIALTASLVAMEGKEKELERVIGALSEKVLANESGCVLYQLARSRNDPRAYVLLERYRDEAALSHHSNTDYFKAAIPEMMACLDGPPRIAMFEDVE